MNFCEHCGPVSEPVVEHDGVTWCPACANANGIKMPKAKVKTTVNFADLVAEELASARNGHDPINSLHEGLSVLQEEVFEFQTEVYKRRSKRNLKKTLAELVQVAAMAQRIAEDVLL